MADPINSEATIEAANSLILQGQMDKALELFRKHLGEEPHDEKVHNFVHSILLAPDQGRGLVEFYRELQRQYPDDWRHLVNLSRAYSRTGKDSLAVVQLQKLLRNDSSLMQVWLDLAQCYLRLDKMELALRAFNSLLDLHPDCNEAHIERVRLLARAGELEEAAAAAIFSLESKGIRADVRGWLEEVDLVLESGDTPDADLLTRFPDTAHA